MNDHNISEYAARIPERRQQRIAQRLRESGSVTVAALEAEFGISPATARRDLSVLEMRGKAKRTHGGAVLPGGAQHADSFPQRVGEAGEGHKTLSRAPGKPL